MNESCKFTAEQQATFNTNEELAELAADIRAELEGRWTQLSPVDHFFISQFGKAQRTFVAIQTLVRHSLIEDALCLLRILVENTINLKYGICSDPVEVVRRYSDWAMLDSIRRARANNWFKGTRLASTDRKELFLKTEGEIRRRYSKAEFESLKRSVFGISLEERAETAGLSNLYHASYRVLSRNVHAMDIAVMESTRSTIDMDQYNDLLVARVSHLLDIAQWCLGTLALWVNGQFQCSLDKELEQLRVRS
jgi:hypothetical protein